MSDTRSDIDVPASTLLNSDAVDRAPMASDAPVERELSARDRIMAAVVAKRERELEGEIKTWDENSSGTLDSAMAEQSASRKPTGDEREEDRVYTGPYADPDESAASDATPPGRSAPERPQDAIGGKPNADVPAGRAAPAPQPMQPQTFPIDIDGQQVYVTQEQMAHLARMGAIANQALYQYNQGATQPRPPAPASIPDRGQPAPQPTREAGAAPISKERIREIARAIQYGDEDSATGAIEGLLSEVAPPQVPQIDLDAHRRSILAEARREAHMEAISQQSVAIVRAEYADIAANPILQDAAARQLAMLRQHNIALGNQFSEFDLVREAGNRVRAAFGGQPQPTGQTPAPAGQTAPQASNVVVRRSVAEIDGRKRAAPQRTAAVIDRRSAAPEAPRPPTGSDIVEQMRKSRFQSPMR